MFAWDLFGLLATPDVEFYVDDKTYPIMRWGLERARSHGSRVRFFRHHSAGSLSSLLRRSSRKRRPIIVTDGWCPRCGRPAPLPSYIRIAKQKNGLVIMDDTQALGILGAKPYFRNSLWIRWWWIASLVWYLVRPLFSRQFTCERLWGYQWPCWAGDKHFIRPFKSESQTRMHCSPPAMPTLIAAELALNKNRTIGNQVRKQLLRNSRWFRKILEHFDVPLRNSWFPIQVVPSLDIESIQSILAILKTEGIDAISLRRSNPLVADLAFLIRANQTNKEIRHSGLAIGKAFHGARKRNKKILKNHENKTIPYAHPA